MKAYEWELKYLKENTTIPCDAGEHCYIELYFDELSSANHLNVFPIKNESSFMIFSNHADIEELMKSLWKRVIYLFGLSLKAFGSKF